MMNYKVSIVIPVYNAEKYLSRCIDSLINQTYTNIEIILVNDGSNDNSGSICDAYALQDSRIVVIHKDNGGVSSTRNQGICSATGDYICFVDSDDWVDKDYIESFFVCEELGHGFLVVQGIKYYIPDKGIEIPMFSYEDEVVTLAKDINKLHKANLLSNGCPVAKLFDLHLIKEKNLLFNQKLSINEDHLFVITYYRYVSQVYTVSRVAYYYYYDYKVDSLTKRTHSVNEYLLVSKEMKMALNFLLQKFQDDEVLWTPYYSLLVVSPIIKASYSCFTERQCYNNLSKCKFAWREVEVISCFYVPKTLYEKMAKMILGYPSILVLIALTPFYCLDRIVRKIKFFIKRFILQW